MAITTSMLGAYEQQASMIREKLRCEEEMLRSEFIKQQMRDQYYYPSQQPTAQSAQESPKQPTLLLLL